MGLFPVTHITTLVLILDGNTSQNYSKLNPKPFGLTSTSSSRVDLSYMLNPDIGEDIAIVLEAAYVAINQFVVSPDQKSKVATF